MLVGKIGHFLFVKEKLACQLFHDKEILSRLKSEICWSRVDGQQEKSGKDIDLVNRNLSRKTYLSSTRASLVNGKLKRKTY